MSVSAIAEEHVDVPIKVGRFDITKPLWLAGTEEDEICRNEIVVLQTHDITSFDTAPLDPKEAAGVRTLARRALSSV